MSSKFKILRVIERTTKIVQVHEVGNADRIDWILDDMNFEAQIQKFPPTEITLATADRTVEKPRKLTDMEEALYGRRTS